MAQKERDLLSEETPTATPETVTPPSKSEPSAAKEAILERIHDWKKYWENSDIGCYIKHYADDFQHGAMSRDDWERDKGAKFVSGTGIQVTLKNIEISRSGENADIRFLQTYRTGQHRDVGIKKIRMRKQRDEWRIVQKEWTPYDKPEAQRQ